MELLLINTVLVELAIKTSLVIAPICASCGIYVPKMSGRGLGLQGVLLISWKVFRGFK